MEKGVNVNLKDVKVFKKLFSDFYVTLCCFARGYIEDGVGVNDIVQDAFVSLWQRKEDFNYLHQAIGFLYTTVKNAAINDLKHRKVKVGYAERVLSEEDEAYFHNRVIEEETYRLLRSAIEKLPDATRKVMLLALDGHGNKQIAEMLSIAEGTVHTHKKIAYRRIREELKDYFYVLPLFISLFYN